MKQLRKCGNAEFYQVIDVSKTNAERYRRICRVAFKAVGTDMLIK
jgi:hypothetical protein